MAYLDRLLGFLAFISVVASNVPAFGDVSPALTTTARVATDDRQDLRSFIHSVEEIEVVIRARRPAELTQDDLRQLSARLVLKSLQELDRLKSADLEWRLADSGRPENVKLVLAAQGRALQAMRKAAVDLDREGVIRIGISIQARNRTLRQWLGKVKSIGK